MALTGFYFFYRPNSSSQPKLCAILSKELFEIELVIYTDELIEFALVSVQREPSYCFTFLTAIEFGWEGVNR